MNMKDIGIEKFAYIAGIIDSDGSISLKYNYRIDGKRRVMIRGYVIRIKMCDGIVVPIIAKWLDINHLVSKGNKTHSITFGKSRAVNLINFILPYLYTKQERANLFLKAANIKKTNESYTEDETSMWAECFDKLRYLNGRGKISEGNDDYERRTHEFHWAWVAGIIDGDGSIMVNKWTISGRIIQKPVMQINMTNHQTIAYLAEMFSIRIRTIDDKRAGDRRQASSIRLMPQKLMEFLPKVIPYLVFKKKLAILALEICELRRDTPNGSHNHPNIELVKEKIKLFKELNKDKYMKE